MRLYLIRHGESVNNAIQSSNSDFKSRVPDPELTETGHRQAKLLADYLADPLGDPLQHPSNVGEGRSHGFDLTHVYCSLMTRSILTAQYVAKACGLPLMAHADIFEKQGVYEEAADGAKVGLPGPDRKDFNDRFPDLGLPADLRHGGWYNRPAETPELFLLRSKQVALEFERRHVGTDDSVAMIIHGDLIDQLINEFTGLSRRDENYSNHWEGNWAVHNTSITRVDFNSRSKVVVYTNRLQHLSPELITW
ncbi:histidine phosphatase family protein [Pelagibius sp. Alg239-R121]|uniref:histidine phosphatase family protein n=1 Tax=Pelagibius sp. Alg239-R121 TaxID=2993448 RepID=UPI0024A6C182|nr:histidine phosphatase family protein [Pelagibius sp. Alg239-R121]